MIPYFFVIFLDLSDVIRLHDIAIESYGGVFGIRDIGLLESALHQPIMLVHYGDESDTKISNLAATYLFHIIKNHPFIDGNKRAGIFATIHFLNINHFDLEVDLEMLYLLALDVAASQINKEEIAIFLQKHIKSL